jgi:cation diffusion facilitator CzcD-associated flavoprotein CzcO
MESGYYEAYNRPNVSLVDLRETPIERITETGIVTSAGEQPFDVIIWATGFDAVTGALTRMGVVGEDGVALADFWADGPRTYVGVSIPHFPNFFFVGGPHFPFSNVPRGTEVQVEFVTALIDHVLEHGYSQVVPDDAAEEAWTAHLLETAEPFLVADSSWFRGANIPGKAERILLYFGGLVVYRAKLEEVVRNGYEGFVLRKELAGAGSRAG